MNTHTINPNLTPTTVLVPCYNNAGQIWAVRIASGQRGAGQFTGTVGFEILQYFAALTFLAYSHAAHQKQVRGKVISECYIAVQPSGKPLEAATRHAERQHATIEQWTK